MWNPYERVKKFRAEFAEPPHAVPDGDVDVSGNGRWRIWQFSGTKTDAPMLGNGDMLAAFAGPAEYPQFWVTANDFWQMESNPNWEFFHDNSTAKVDPAVSTGGPRPVGRLVFSIPELKGASYHAKQSFARAETTVTYTKGSNESLEIKSLVAATENVLILSFTSHMQADLRLESEFRFPDETGWGCDKGVDLSVLGGTRDDLKGTVLGLVSGQPVQVKQSKDGVLFGYREYADQVDVPVKAGFGGRFIGHSDPQGTDQSRETLVLHPRESVYYVFVLRSWDKVSRPMEMARSRAEWISEHEIHELLEQHYAWWENYWNISGLMLDDPILESRYYLSQYVMGSLSRDIKYPPNILGIATFDRPAWNANYKINYNHQSSYLGLLVSGHFEQADPHDAPYLAMMDIGREMGHRIAGHDGVYLPLGMGPKEMVSEALLLHMKSQGVHGATNMLMRYALTEDRSYARHIYPFLQSLADFWENDLVWKDGSWQIRDDSMHERLEADVRENGESWNPSNTLGYLKVFFEAIAKISEDIGLDAKRREKWREIARNLAPYPTGTLAEIANNPTLWAEADVPLHQLVPEKWMHRKVFYNEGTGGKWSYHFPGNIMQIYPGGAIGLGSESKLLETARNTIHLHALIENNLAEYRGEHDTGADDLDNERGEEDAHYRKSGAWNAMNLSCLFFPAAVRVGYDAEVIWQELRERILHRGLPNGFINRNPHGIENLSTVPNTLQEMMLQSQEGIVRIFPVWPRKQHPKAAFQNFWACGAFQVSAELVQGEVEEVLVTSHKGHALVLENPWPGSPLRIYHVQTGKEEVRTGEHLKVEMFAGEKIRICKESA